MRYRHFVDFRHGISVFANFCYGTAVLGTPKCPPHFVSKEIQLNNPADLSAMKALRHKQVRDNKLDWKN